MKADELKLEIELRMFWIKKNKDKKWWQFWKPNEIRVLSECDSSEEAIDNLAKEQGLK